MYEDSLKTKIIRIITGVLLVAVIVGGLCFIWPNYRRSQTLKLQSAALDDQIAAKQQQISELKDRQLRFKTDPDFVEQIARENRRVFPGELVFVFEKEK